MSEFAVGDVCILIRTDPPAYQKYVGDDCVIVKIGRLTRRSSPRALAAGSVAYRDGGG